MMRPLCTICGRPTTPLLFFGREPVGPTCARKLGLTKAKVGNRNLRVRFAAYKPAREAQHETLELFASTIQGAT